MRSNLLCGEDKLANISIDDRMPLNYFELSHCKQFMRYNFVNFIVSKDIRFHNVINTL